MTAETLLAHLQGVHKTGPASWRAKCPACNHPHDTGALAINESSGGTILVHCFRCGDTAAILAAVGLTVADLYPERIRDPSPEARQRAREAFKHSAWSAALRVLSREATVVGCAAGMLRQGHALTDDDDTRLTLSMQRINDARAVLA